MFELLHRDNLIETNPWVKQRLHTTRTSNKIGLTLRNVWKHIDIFRG